MRKWLLLTVAMGLVAASMVALASASRTSTKITPSAETANAYLPKGVKPCTNDWMYYGCDVVGTAYSQLTQINKTNVKDLQVAWVHQSGVVIQGLESTPLVIDGVMYYIASNNRVESKRVTVRRHCNVCSSGVRIEEWVVRSLDTT
jgi:alcohol dehydrogenase (cytochrome c)